MHAVTFNKGDRVAFEITVPKDGPGYRLRIRATEQSPMPCLNPKEFHLRPEGDNLFHNETRARDYALKAMLRWPGYPLRLTTCS